ncbi:uncharacterized protein LOC124272284 isoform X2 [Haliotis rubra]|uniref:uncharacterized protein LOC124272284 isoform X2 n=1 Tax=Haliotis rubra TaxID=36100 RepID=UPI001EE5116E|nr:uncharacterized protein LOC124272284 isoform X2 [Haliotis rubra]
MSSQRKAVVINATEDVYLYVFFTDATGVNDVGGYMAIPTGVLTSSYIAVTYNRNDVSPYNNFILVAAVEDNTTVTMNVKRGDMCLSANTSDGDVVVITLNRNNVFGFMCRDDVTGTVIISDKKVVVVSGHECAMVPGAASKCNFLVEMMIPVECFGEQFVFSPPNIVGGAIYRIVSAYDNTVITDSSGFTSTLNVGDFEDVDLSTASKARCIETSQPCVVVVINVVTLTNIASDMAIVPSFDRYLNNYTIDILNFVDAFNGMYMSVVDAITSTVTVSGCNAQLMTFKVEIRTQTDFVNISIPKGVIVYGQSLDENDMASFPLGMIFDKDECASTPCYNNATCDDLVYNYACICQPGFNGSLCEIDIDECWNSPCQNNATCHDDVNGFHCECLMGFNGTLCETNIDECVSSPCQNNATCRDDVNGLICDCQVGFAGDMCQEDVDECLSGPCRNNATCLDMVNGYVCLCSQGFSGGRCETDIDECLTTTCENGGTCEDLPGYFLCHCEADFHGVTCENNGYKYVFTRLIDVDNTLLTSSGVTIVATQLATGIRFETTYSTALVMSSISGADPETDCVCTRYSNGTEEAVDEEVLMSKIKNELLLDTSILTKTVNKYVSNEDDRPSAKGLGSVGCVIIVFTILLIVAPDVLYVLRKLDDSRKKRRRALT